MWDAPRVSVSYVWLEAGRCRHLETTMREVKIGIRHRYSKLEAQFSSSKVLLWICHTFDMARHSERR